MGDTCLEVHRLPGPGPGQGLDRCLCGPLPSQQIALMPTRMVCTWSLRYEILCVPAAAETSRATPLPEAHADCH